MYYNEHIKRQAVRLVVCDGLGLAEVSRRFGIKGHSTLAKWIKRMGNNKDTKLNESATVDPVSSHHITRIAELEKQLKLKSMEADFYRVMVDEAEKMFDIEIKKSQVQSRFQAFKGKLVDGNSYVPASARL